MDVAAEVIFFKHLQDVSFVLDVLDLLFASNALFLEALEGVVLVRSFVLHKVHLPETPSTQLSDDDEVFDVEFLFYKRAYRLNDIRTRSSHLLAQLRTGMWDLYQITAL